MPRVYTCCRCGKAGTKKDATVVVSRFTDLAYCADVGPCIKRQLRQVKQQMREAS